MEEAAASSPIDAARARQVAGFLAHLRSERRLSGHTVAAYERDVACLLELVGRADLAQIDSHLARRLLGRLHARGLHPRSLARTLCAWRSFYRYLARDHGFARNPFQGLRPPRSPRELPHALSPDEAGKLLDFAGDEVLNLRDLAMFELLYSSGLRLSELTGLDVEDIDLEEGTMRVTGKGNKTRIVPVGRAALAALRAWLARRPALLRSDTHRVFLARNGAPLSNRAVQQRLHLRGVRQDLTQAVHPHMLRHSFASHVLQSSGDLRAVQEMLGHASISSTQIYTHLDFQHLAKVYDAAHPRAKKK